MTSSVSSSTSSGVGTLSSPGLGSGLDVNGIVTQLVALEKQPLKELQSSAKSLNVQLSSYGTLQSQISSMNDAAAKLAKASTWTDAAASSTNAAAVNATVSGSPAAGVYTIAVSQLAAGQTTASPPAASASSTIGNGTLNIELGTWNTNHTAFTSAGAPISVTIDASNNSLSGIASAINAANAGVSASVVQDVNGARLVVNSTSTGASAGFRLQVNDVDGNNTDAAGLSSLAYDPPAGALGTTVKDAANAKATVNGLPVESATNSLAQTVSGLNIQLTQTTGSAPVNITVTPDTSAMTDAVNTFVTAYNALNSSLAYDLKYDAGTKVSGPLQGDRSTIALQSSMRQMLGATSSASSTYGQLSSLGIAVQRDGSLLVNSTKFNAALSSNLAEVQKFFATPGVNAASNGFGTRLQSWGNGLLGVTGAVTNKQNAIRSSIKQNGKDQDSVNNHAADVEKRLRAQYTALDSNVAKLNALNTYVTQQITGWNNQKSQ